MNIFRLFKRKNEFEEYMEILKQSESSGTYPMPPWMSMPQEIYERAYKEYLKIIGE